MGQLRSRERQLGIRKKKQMIQTCPNMVMIKPLPDQFPNMFKCLSELVGYPPWDIRYLGKEAKFDLISVVVVVLGKIFKAKRPDLEPKMTKISKNVILT